MRTRNALAAAAVVLASAAPVRAQLYTGLSGLIHVPSAEMNPEGTARIGGYFLNRHFTPDNSGPYGFTYEGKKYNTTDYYLSVTPFRWMEVGYTFTLFKTLEEGYDRPKYNQKDRYFSLKLNPLREGKYHPAIAVGGNDIFGSPTRWRNEQGSGAGYFCNYYIAATKHFQPWGHRIGVNVAYRYCPKVPFRKWEGVVGGVTWQPKGMPNLRAIVEYTGNEINIGADCLLWRHLFLQAAMVEGRYFTGGLCLQMNLL